MTLLAGQDEKKGGEKPSPFPAKKKKKEGLVSIGKARRGKGGPRRQTSTTWERRRRGKILMSHSLEQKKEGGGEALNLFADYYLTKNFSERGGRARPAPLTRRRGPIAHPC